VKLTSQNSGKGKWTPLIALALLFVLCVVLLSALAAAPSLTGGVSRARAGLITSIVMGCYFALFLMHMVLYLLFRASKTNLLFSLSCLMWLLYTGVHGHDVLFVVAPPMWFIETLGLAVLIRPIIVLLMLGILSLLFPRVLQKWFIYVMTILMVASIVTVFIAPIALVDLAAVVVNIALCVAALYIVVRLLLKLRRIMPEHVVFLAGAVIFLWGAFNDFLRGNSNDMLPMTRLLIQNYPLIFSFFASAAFFINTIQSELDASADEQLLSAQSLIDENMLDFQRQHYGQFMTNAESVKYLRHDMRHHLTVINEYVQEGNYAGIKGYMEGLEHGLSSMKGRVYCENHAVNVICAHYLGIAEREGVNVSAKLTVPSDVGHVRDSDLCVIVGNFLENAVEACRKVPAGGRFIKFFSYFQGNSLVFDMENSFDGDFYEQDGIIYSSKRDGEGIGLSSVRAVATEYGGVARFEARGKVFLSSVYVDLGEEDEDEAEEE